MDAAKLEYQRCVPVHRRNRGPWVRILVLGFLILFGAFWLFQPGLVWDGGAWVDVRVHVTDAATGQPLSHVSLQFLNDDGISTGHEGTTDASGVGTLKVFVGAGGSRGMLYQSMSYGRDDPVILVQRPGYIDRTMAPGDGSAWKIFGFGPEPKLSINVPLSAGPSTTAPSR